MGSAGRSLVERDARGPGLKVTFAIGCGTVPLNSELFGFRFNACGEPLLVVEEVLAVGDLWMLVTPLRGSPPAPDAVA